MFIKQIVIGINRFLGVVLVFSYTIGIALMATGVISSVAFFKSTMTTSCIGFPTILSEKYYFRDELKEE